MVPNQAFLSAVTRHFFLTHDGDASNYSTHWKATAMAPTESLHAYIGKYAAHGKSEHFSGADVRIVRLRRIEMLFATVVRF
jgi:hypothetical protein